jgi:acetyl-CoA carboxylase carboxyl transferase subunit beta
MIVQGSNSHPANEIFNRRIAYCRPIRFMSWFSKSQPEKEPEQKKIRTEGLWIKCDSCRAIIWKKDLEANQMVCSKCGFHFKIDARSRLKLLFDDGTWQEFDNGLTSTDALEFVDQKPYSERLAAAEKATGLKDAVISAEGKMAGRNVAVCAMEYRFIGGSMGAVVGEKITRAIERAIDRRVPVVVISASGGARMMEGAVSLMQMAKISSALMKLEKAKLPYISVLTDPTTGGVTASYAMLGDLNIAEPGALIGFAGPRVIEQTIRQKLPKGFQRSEFLLEHGMLDAIVARPDIKTFLASAFDFFCGAAA